MDLFFRILNLSEVEMNRKRWLVLGIVSGLCVMFFGETLIRKILGEIDKYKAGRDVIGMSGFKNENYEN